MVVVQADGNGPGDYMHSGMRGGPHVGAFRRCSFTEAEIYLQLYSSSVSRNPPASLAYQQVLQWPCFRPSYNCFPSAQGAPIKKLIPSRKFGHGCACFPHPHFVVRVFRGLPSLLRWFRIGCDSAVLGGCVGIVATWSGVGNFKFRMSITNCCQQSAIGNR